MLKYAFRFTSIFSRRGFNQHNVQESLRFQQLFGLKVNTDNPVDLDLEIAKSLEPIQFMKLIRQNKSRIQKRQLTTVIRILGFLEEQGFMNLENIEIEQGYKDIIELLNQQISEYNSFDLSDVIYWLRSFQQLFHNNKLLQQIDQYAIRQKISENLRSRKYNIKHLLKMVPTMTDYLDIIDSDLVIQLIQEEMKNQYIEQVDMIRFLQQISFKFHHQRFIIPEIYKTVCDKILQYIDEYDIDQICITAAVFGQIQNECFFVDKQIINFLEVIFGILKPQLNELTDLQIYQLLSLCAVTDQPAIESFIKSILDRIVEKLTKNLFSIHVDFLITLIDNKWLIENPKNKYFKFILIESLTAQIQNDGSMEQINAFCEFMYKQNLRNQKVDEIVKAIPIQRLLNLDDSMQIIIYMHVFKLENIFPFLEQMQQQSMENDIHCLQYLILTQEYDQKYHHPQQVSVLRQMNILKLIERLTYMNFAAEQIIYKQLVEELRGKRYFNNLRYKQGALVSIVDSKSAKLWLDYFIKYRVELGENLPKIIPISKYSFDVQLVKYELTENHIYFLNQLLSLGVYFCDIEELIFTLVQADNLICLLYDHDIKIIYKIFEQAMKSNEDGKCVAQLILLIEKRIPNSITLQKAQLKKYQQTNPQKIHIMMILLLLKHQFLSLNDSLYNKVVKDENQLHIEIQLFLLETAMLSSTKYADNR
ncbi:hypothetical protein pb186bvf_000912 [Paramecium bursaria]